jgi:hypothetical protein
MEVAESSLALADIPSAAEAALKSGIYVRAEARTLQCQDSSATSEARTPSKPKLFQ